MYLISIYFDESTNKRIRQHINQVAKASGNTYMIDEKVPVHITLSAIDTRNIEKVEQALEQMIHSLQRGTLQWVSIGAFLPHVLYLQPLQNHYLFELMNSIYDAVSTVEDVTVRKCYQPFCWVPHTTIAKKLSQEEMQAGFEVLQRSFGVFEGTVTRIGLAKTTPYTDIRSWDV